MQRSWMDLKFAARMLWRNPWSTAAAAVTLALGIGANTALFSIINTLLIRPLPFEEPESLVFILESRDEFDWMSVSYPNFLDWREQNGVFEQMTAHRQQSFNLTGGDRPERLLATQVSASLFPMLRTEPILGRPFLEEEDRPGAAGVVVLDNGLWQRRFGGREDVLGQSILLDGDAYTVVGVMPEGFLFPLVEPEIELYLPIGRFSEAFAGRDDHSGIEVNARLLPGVPIARAQAEMRAIARRLEEEYPETNTGQSVRAELLHDVRVMGVRPALPILAGAVGLVLLIACANVASLLLARSASRVHEFAVRGSLGAGRARLARQLLTESVLQSLLGGALGTLIAVWSVNLISLGMPDATPPVFRGFEVDGLVLAFTLLLTIATGLVFGLAPALQASRTDLAGALKQGGPGTPGGAARQRIQSALVTGEIALALVLLIGAGLLMKSLLNLIGKNPGFNPEAVVTMQVSLPESRYPRPDQVSSFFLRLDEALRTLPGVRHTGASNPLFGGWQDHFLIEGQPAAAPGEESWTEITVVSRDYFRALEIPLLAGRTFDERDREGSPRVAIVDRRFAESRWPGQDPIGKRLKRGNDPASELPWLEVVGVVETVRKYGEFFELNPRICLYQPHQQVPSRYMSLVVKGDAPSEAVVAAVRNEVLRLDPDQPVFNIRTMERYLADRLYVRRFVLGFLAVFAGVAILLAAVGIYGLMAYSVSQRTKELGVRVAMGAEARDVFRLVAGRGLRLTAAGVACGLLAAHVATPLMEGLLFGVGARDPLVFASLTVLVALVALGATVLPARRAAHISPVTALRNE